MIKRKKKKKRTLFVEDSQVGGIQLFQGHSTVRDWVLWNIVISEVGTLCQNRADFLLR